MANDKSFKIKNGLQAGRYLGTNGTETAGSNGPYGTFDTTLYSGTSATQSITNNVDLSTDGGLVWIKNRGDGTADHSLWDTERGAFKYLKSNAQDAEIDLTSFSTGLTAFNSNGFTLGGGDKRFNQSANNYVAWTFKQASNFFDVVTWTGDGTAGRTISHSLGSSVGTIIVKRTDGATEWQVLHRNDGSQWKTGILNSTTSFDNATANLFGNGSSFVAPTSTEFTVTGNLNGSTDEFVAYLFAHDTSADSYIKCGNYTGTGTAGLEVDLGFKPSWLLIKNTSNSLWNWLILDTVRGIVTGGNDALLFANGSNAESTTSNHVAVSSSGFSLESTSGVVNSSGHNFIYVAIRAVVPTETLDLSTGHTFSITPTEATDVLFSNPPASGTATAFTVEVNNSAGGYAITWPSSVKWHLGTAPTATASKEVYTFITTDGGTTYYGKKAGENLA